MNYKCPICGKTYSNAMAMAKCVNKCALKENENEVKRATALTEEITKTYTKLESLIREYNSLNTGKLYTATISSSSKDSLDKNVVKGDNVTKTNKKPSEDSEFEKFFKESFNIKEPKSNSKAEKKVLGEDEFVEALSEIFNSIIEGTREDEFAKTLSEIFNS